MGAKDTGTIRKNLISMAFCILAGIFGSSCGMDVVYSITEPLVTYNNPLYSSTDYLTWYFNFKTAPSSDTEGLGYTGTDVYYKIYNNYSNLTSHRSAINSVNTASNGSSAATRMIETYTYQPLGTSLTTRNSNAVFFENHDNATVILRLKNYQNGLSPASEDYEELLKTRYTLDACVGYRVGSEYVYENYIPYRNSAVGTKSFDFFDYDEDDKAGTRDVEPEEGDADYYHSSSSSESNCYYVQLYAVARAWNTSAVSPVYSLVLDLGSVPIRKGE